MTARRRIVEQTPSINIRELRKRGLPPCTESVIVRTAHGFAEQVSLIWRNTPFGGRRSYFQCPHCLKGAEILYGAPFLACRKCHSLAYRSENLTPLWRRSEKLRKLQEKAGADTSRLPCILAKPKWMRWHTYLNLRRRMQEAGCDFAEAWMRSRHSLKLRRGKAV